jgi:Ca-activated chloride channel family protein
MTALIGARQLLGLEHLIHSGLAGDKLRDGLRRLGYDLANVPGLAAGKPAKVYAENARDEVGGAIRDLLVRESLACGVACSETAFLAVRSESGRVVEGRVRVAGALGEDLDDDLDEDDEDLDEDDEDFDDEDLDDEIDDIDLEEDLDDEPDEDLDDEIDDVDGEDVDDSAGVIDEEHRLAPGHPGGDVSPPPPGLRGGPDRFLAPPRGATGGPSYGGGGRAPEPSGPTRTVVFQGVPAFVDGQCILFDSDRPDTSGVLPGLVSLSGLVLRFPDGDPDARAVDPGLMLLVYLDDLTSPRARVRLVDLVRQQGERPLNVRKGPGQVFQIVLVDPAGAWAIEAPRLELALAW